MKKIILTASLSLLLGACASNGGTASAGQEDASQAIATAEAARQEAKAVGYEWRDTGKLIAAAEKAAEAKEYDKAVSLANKAERQSENALKQQSQQAKAAAAH